jgi:hypothetical protein
LNANGKDAKMVWQDALWKKVKAHSFLPTFNILCPLLEQGDQIGLFLLIGLLFEVHCDFLKRCNRPRKWQQFGLFFG